MKLNIKRQEGDDCNCGNEDYWNMAGICERCGGYAR